MNENLYHRVTRSAGEKAQDNGPLFQASSDSPSPAKCYPVKTKLIGWSGTFYQRKKYGVIADSKGNPVYPYSPSIE